VAEELPYFRVITYLTHKIRWVYGRFSRDRVALFHVFIYLIVCFAWLPPAFGVGRGVFSHPEAKHIPVLVSKDIVIGHSSVEVGEHFNRGDDRDYARGVGLSVAYVRSRVRSNWTESFIFSPGRVGVIVSEKDLRIEKSLWISKARYRFANLIDSLMKFDVYSRSLASVLKLSHRAKGTLNDGRIDASYAKPGTLVDASVSAGLPEGEVNGSYAEKGYENPTYSDPIQVLSKTKTRTATGLLFSVVLIVLGGRLLSYSEGLSDTDGHSARVRG